MRGRHGFSSPQCAASLATRNFRTAPNLAQCAFASVQVVRDADEALAVLADGESQRHFAATNMCATSAPGRGLCPHLGPCFVQHKGLPRNTARLSPSRSCRGTAPRRDGRLGCAWCMLAWHRTLRTGVTSGAALALQWLYCGCTVVALCLYCACTWPVRRRNNHSSRSHVVLVLVLETRKKVQLAKMDVKAIATRAALTTFTVWLRNMLDCGRTS